MINYSRMTRSKIVLARETKFYLENGLVLPNQLTPPIIAIRNFWNKIMEKVFFSRNVTNGHLCTASCGRIVRMLIGSGLNMDGYKEPLICKISSEMIEHVEELEEMIEIFASSKIGNVKIGALGLCFTPCTKKLEILESAIYLKDCNF